MANTFQDWSQEIDATTTTLNETAAELRRALAARSGSLPVADLTQLAIMQTLQLQAQIMQADFALRHGRPRQGHDEV
jgi:hypothetical protein